MVYDSSRTEYFDARLRRFFDPLILEEAYREYKEKKTDYFDHNNILIKMGADGSTYIAFEAELTRNCQFISRKVLQGNYLFYPLREVEVKKPDGGKRTLSIASIRDVLVQIQLYKTIYPVVERLFSHNTVNYVSFAYRKGRSPQQAALYVQKYIKDGFIYALDADIVKYFDNIPHASLLDLLRHYFGADTRIYKLLARFVRTDRVLFSSYRRESYFKKRIRLFGKDIFRKIKPKRTRRVKGIPQGGVISGMLANLYLHNFDKWVVNELSKVIELRYVRYADDFVILVKDQDLLPQLRDLVSAKLDEIGLELHKDTKKTKLLDIVQDGLDFVGFHLTSTDILIRDTNIRKFQERFLEKLASDIEWNIHPRNVEHRLRLLVQNKLNYKIRGRPDDICPNCHKPINARPKNWINAFSVVTKIDQLKELDLWVRAEIAAHFYRHYGFSVKRRMLRSARLASLEQEYYALKKRQICECPIVSNDSDQMLADNI